MSGGTIFQKQVFSGPLADGTGDNCLKIDQNYAYQVPFSFGDDWNKIKIGMFLSFVSGDELNRGVGHIGREDTGGSTNDTFNWIGITKNQNTKSLPLDTVNQGFVGHKSNAIYVFPNSSAEAYNKLRIYDLNQTAFDNVDNGNALAVSSFGSSTLSTGLIEYDQGNIGAVYPVFGSWAEPGHSGRIPEDVSTAFCEYVGMEFEVHNKRQEDQKISLKMFGRDLDLAANQSTIGGDISIDRLKLFLNGLDEEGVQVLHTDAADNNPNEITGLVFNDGSNAYDIPDSFFFYNAMPVARPRIHAWAVKRFS